ncbi:putative aldehyde dehydrogenase [Talaromyces proteolyticus]|uniref:aldehyde dehydrogenase (NAD(+)) n=1 Tax=Talaromyces proteolyticus TaxID=1131652 RepID=A0AAD4KKY2_9EURO|nr:putative aldehyde dehydrogenase [Talaromyces proteolyticus]KAH8693987.1 putative aldehyde dehydrogenase [Talaromyces proteolyticus]
MKDQADPISAPGVTVSFKTPHQASSSNTFFAFSNTINGVARKSTRVAQAVNPSNRQPLWDVPVAREVDVNEAVTAANDAFLAWSRTPWAERAQYLTRAKDALLEIRDEMASLIMLETGKPIQLATLEVDQSIRLLLYYAAHPELKPKVVTDNDDLQLTVRYVSMGVVAAMCPCNDPLMLATGKIAPALLTGNAVIVKPSPFAPYSILKFVEHLKSLFPPGVIQALNGDGKLGSLLVEHPEVQRISFTGSITTGKKVMAAASKTLKRVTLELSGNGACVVCPDVDVSLVAPQVAVGAFLNSGQFCLSSRRIYVHEDIYNDFMQHIVDAVKPWKASLSPGDKGMLGPIQNEAHYRNVKQIFEDSQSKGYKFALGSPTVDDGKSFVIQPAIIDNPPEGSRVVTEEAFGPIVSLIQWKDENDVIARVNNTNTGLGASVWSGDIDCAIAIGEQIQSGMITINRYPTRIPSGHLSGWKESGPGGEGGTEGLLSYCNVQTMHCYKMSVAPGSAEAD